MIFASDTGMRRQMYIMLCWEQEHPLVLLSAFTYPFQMRLPVKPNHLGECYLHIPDQANQLRAHFLMPAADVFLHSANHCFFSCYPGSGFSIHTALNRSK